MVVLSRLNFRCGAIALAFLAMPAPSFAQAPSAAQTGPARNSATPADKAAAPSAAPTQDAPAAKSSEPAEPQPDATSGVDRAVERAKRESRSSRRAQTSRPADPRSGPLVAAQRAWSAPGCGRQRRGRHALPRLRASARRSVSPRRSSSSRRCRSERGDEEFADSVGKLTLVPRPSRLSMRRAARPRPSRPSSASSRQDCATELTRDFGPRGADRRKAGPRCPRKSRRTAAAGEDPIRHRCAPLALLAERRARAAKINLLRAGGDQPARATGVDNRAARPGGRQARQARQAHPDHRGHALNYLKEVEQARRQEEADREARKLAAQHPVLEAYVEGHRGHPQSASPMRRARSTRGKPSSPR